MSEKRERAEKQAKADHSSLTDHGKGFEFYMWNGKLLENFKHGKA